MDLSISKQLFKVAQNAQLTERIRNKLLRIKGLKEKQMFRGTTFMINRKICLSTGDDELMCRFDPALHNIIMKTQGSRPMIMKNREYKGYVFIKEDKLSKETDLEYWITLAFEYNSKLLKSKKRK